MEKLLKKRCSFQTPLSAAAALAFLGFYLCAYFGKLRFLFAALALALLLIFWTQAVYVKNKLPLSSSDKISLPIVFSALALLLASFVSVAARRIRANGSGFVPFLILAAITLGAICIEIYFWRSLAKSSERSAKKDIPSILKEYLPIAILCGVLIVLNIDILDAWIRWDSYDYFYYINRLDYSSFYDFEILRLANHASYSCSIIYIVMNGIIGNSALTVYVVNILVMVLGTFVFWRTVTKLFPKWSNPSRMLVSCVYAFSPMILGLVYSINIEFFLAFGILLFFWGEAEKMPFVQTLSAFLICFSKETGVVVLGAVMVARLALKFFGKANKSRPLYERLDMSLSAPILFCGLLSIFDILRNSWLESNTNAMETAQGEVFNAFSFSPTFIANRFISLVFSNFTWLILAVVIGGGIAMLVSKRRKAKEDGEERDEEKRLFYTECIVGLVATLIPIFLFVTYNHIRYGVVFIVILLLLLPEALDILFSGYKLKTAVGGILACCCLVQCYVTADPAMYLFFDTLDKGNGKVIYTPNDILVSDITSIGVHSQYNREMLYFDTAFDRALAGIGYDDSTAIVVSSLYRNQTIGGYVWAEYLILGWGYPHAENPSYISWDSERSQRYLSDNDDDKMNILYTQSTQFIDVAFDYYDRLIYVQLPFCDVEFESRLHRDFTVTPISTGSCNGWEINTWQISK